MSTHYLIDLHNSGTLASSAILDSVSVPPGDPIRVNGAFPFRMPDYAQVTRPKTLADLTAAKTAGLLMQYAGFTHIVHDDLLNPAGLNLSDPGTRCRVGNRGSIWLPNRRVAAGYGSVTTNLTILGFMTPAPTQAIVIWEVGSYSISDPSTGLLQRTYTEQDASKIDCGVSFDSGTSWLGPTSGAVLNIPPVSQGNFLLLTFGNSSLVETNDFWLCSWAVLY